MSRRIEPPCGGIPIRFAQIEWTPKRYEGSMDYGETLGHAVVIDRRDILSCRERGEQHSLSAQYPCSDGACCSYWENRPTQYLILEVMRICFQLLMFDEGIEKEDILNILYSISETRYIFHDDMYRRFGFKPPNDTEAVAFDKYLSRLYGVSR